MRQLLLISFVVIRLLPATVMAEDGKLPFSVPVNPTSLPETALMETSKGAFEIKFFREEAPITVRNFEYLAKKGFYDNVSFRRYIPDFVIQGGDPTGTGKGNPGYSLPGEFSHIKHIKGTMGMARLASSVNPERRSNGSQFYLCLTRSKHLDGLYTVFAQVINGMNVLEKLRSDDKILHVKFPRVNVSSHVVRKQRNP